MVHSNSVQIIMEKGNDRKILYFFHHNGKVRDMTNGFGKLYNYGEIYRKLINEGYKEVRK